MEPLITITNKVLNRPRSRRRPRPRCPAGVVVAEVTERSGILVIAHGLFFESTYKDRGRVRGRLPASIIR
jgi:hypothetical protein